MMDDQRARELIAQASKSGADDVMIVQRNVRRRSDAIAGRSETHHLGQDSDIALYCAVGNAESAFVWNDAMPPDTDAFAQHVKNAVQAAKLANVWGAARNHVPFAEQFCRTSAQKCPKPDTWDDEPRDPCPKNSRVCHKDCFHPDCMTDTSLAAAQILHTIAGKLAEVSRHLVLHASQTISEITSNCWSADGFVQTRRFETVLSQTVVNAMGDAREERIVLPDYLFDGAGIFTEDEAHKQMLSAADIAPHLAAVQEDVLPDGLFGLLLSPWIVALLAHFSAHLNIDVTQSGKLLQNMDTCLFAPPDSPWCSSRALVHAIAARPTLGLLFARTSSHALFVDAPIAWVRRNRYLVDMQCRVVAEIDERKFSRFYKPVTLRFDLRELWQYCTETAEPSRRLMLRCGDERVVYQAPHAYFPIRPVLGRI